MKLARKIYRYLGDTVDKKFFTDNINFKDTCINKLYEFREKENLKEANVWYRWVFNHRMPIKNPVSNISLCHINFI